MVSLVKSRTLPDNFLIAKSFGGTEDSLIDIEKDTYAQVVKKPMFNGLIKRVKFPNGKHKDLFINKKAKEEFIKRLSNEYKLNPNTVIEYSELLDMEETKVSKWNVIVEARYRDWETNL